MIQISDCEWIIMRDDPRNPAAIVRRLTFDGETFYRIVRWAPTSEGRKLFGYVRTLEIADMCVTFVNEPEKTAGQLSPDRPGAWADGRA